MLDYPEIVVIVTILHVLASEANCSYRFPNSKAEYIVTSLAAFFSGGFSP